MSLNRLLRYLAGLLIATVLIYVICPLVGIAKSEFLPPSSVYDNASGKATGYITNAYSSVTNDPFNVGAKLYFVDYRFKAPDPADPTGKTKAIYTGTVRVTQAQRDAAQVGGTVDVKYETTYPWVNGITDQNIGVSCGPGSNVLSGWLIFVAADFFAAFLVMLVIERFTGREDI